MIRPINFTGIKNVGYTRVIIDHNPNIEEKTIMNMELTDDGKNQDLAEYRKFLKSNPSLKNEINDRFINIEFDSFTVGDGFGTKMGINGNDIFPWNLQILTCRNTFPYRQNSRVQPSVFNVLKSSKFLGTGRQQNVSLCIFEKTGSLSRRIDRHTSGWKRTFPA